MSPPIVQAELPFSASSSVPSPSSGRPAADRRLHVFASLTAACAYLLLIAGGLVTSTDSGLAVPDWPLSYGQYFPRMVGGILFEHGHRMIAGTVGLMTFALAAWIVLRESRRWVKGLAGAAAGGIVLQALLGGMTVLFKLPAPVSIAHACLGQTVFCLLLSLAQVTSPWFTGAVAKGGAGDLWKKGAAAAAFLYAQLILGAIVRHTGHLVPFHLLGAVCAVAAVLVFVFGALNLVPQLPALSAPALLLAALLPVQTLLGMLAYAVRSRPQVMTRFWYAALPTSHVVIGALILGLAVLSTWRAHKLR